MVRTAAGYDPDTSIGGAPTRFPSTRPSIVGPAATADRRRALDALAAAYWKPVYKHIRVKWRASNEDAKDLTQTFFAGLVRGSMLSRFDPGRASFRTYLRLCVDGFVANRRAHDERLKRGGGTVVVAIDDAAVRDALPPDPAPSMDACFHREWQRGLFELGIEDLRQLAAETDRRPAFAAFEAHDLVDEPPSYASLARRFQVTEATLTNHLAWARRELRRLVLQRIEAATTSSEEFAREARSLFGGPR